MSGEAAGAERRATPRYGCAGDAEIVLPGRGLRFQGTIGDLSVGGCFLEVQCALERGTSVEIWMNAEGQPLRVAANLLVRRPAGAGFRFHSLTPRKLEQIRGLIAELAAEKAQRGAAVESAKEGVLSMTSAETPADECLCQELPTDRARGRVRRCLDCLTRRWQRWLRRETVAD